jgi:hypothetical protein
METEPPARVRILRMRWAAALALATLVAVLAAPGSAHATGLPTIASVSPNEGREAGGTPVTITGTNFTGATAVKFGSANAKSFKVNSETSITAVSPAGTGTVNVTVTTAGGTSKEVPADQFNYIPPPTVTEVSPKQGPTSGGTTVTIKGSNLSGATSVQFGSSPASVEAVSETSITAVAPAGTAGVADVRVTTPGGTSAIVPADQFSYVPPPTVMEVSPKEGPTTGGTTVTITGTNLGSASAVNFGTTKAASFMINPERTIITAVSPAGTGTVNVTVTTAGGTSKEVPADQFNYIPPPTVTEVSPKQGPTSGGTTVTIKGSNLSGATSVQFGSSPASVEAVSETSITAVAPAGTAGVADVRVTTPGGTSAIVPADQFSYVPPPTVMEVSPKEGPTTGGTTVTITGTNLGSASAVNFGTTKAASFMINPERTIITAVSPAGTGTVNVTVTTAGGTSEEVPADQFNYIPPPSTPPSNPGTGQAAPPASTASTPSPPLPPTKVKLALIANVHERLIHGTTLEVSFRLTVKARVRMIARRGRKVVARTQFRTLAAGNHRLLLVLSRRRWPTKLELQSRALAPLLTISQ